MGLLYDLAVQAAKRSRTMQSQDVEILQQNKGNSKEHGLFAVENGSCRPAANQAIPEQVLHRLGTADR
ncbi:hypothetical protein P22_3200 [Propionispora sp. 2/2-37]|uniref:hypothetical protein n=1 Tax=Propionispora sp. 2/2-37 TaxID=1677858 RepID=UPI0006BB879E|nr:hypothetical protein [Propionispora sp. 2/2-37]CUH97074.1 hypothetical protein P22_3200 [Propionispora sp. 2/2-37]